MSYTKLFRSIEKLGMLIASTIEYILSGRYCFPSSKQEKGHSVIITIALSLKKLK